MILLSILTIIAVFKYRSIAHSKGLSANRIQIYPIIILLAVIGINILFSFLLAIGISYNLYPDSGAYVLDKTINVLTYLFYFAALNRSMTHLKNCKS